jgi:tRNA threonylcarbamoyl adenosine modification protein YeaZ
VAVLAFDTSTARTAVCVIAGDVLVERSEVSNKPGESLAPLVEAVLADAGVEPSALGAIGVGLGPGPFTGLRVGIVFAAAMAHSLSVPVHGFCSLDAYGVTDGLAVSDARRREVYWARYRSAERVDGPHVTTPAVLAEQLDGDTVTGTRLYAELLHGEGDEYPSAERLARLALRDLELGRESTVLSPLYLRRPDAEESFTPKSVLS